MVKRDRGDALSKCFAPLFALQHPQQSLQPQQIAVRAQAADLADTDRGQPGVPPELFANWEARDPIARFERFLTERGITSKPEIEKLQTRINHEIDDAIQSAEKDPFPEPEDCLKDVYKND